MRRRANFGNKLKRCALKPARTQNIGISNVSINRIENSKTTNYRKQVKVEAIKAPQEKAKDLAQAINQEIETNYRPLPGSPGSVSNIVMRGTSNISGANESDPDIEFEKMHLEYSIIARFELK